MSRILFVQLREGEEGVLLYRGYPIEQIAEHGDFLETFSRPPVRGVPWIDLSGESLRRTRSKQNQKG
jgi:citrate synthase